MNQGAPLDERLKRLRDMIELLRDLSEEDQQRVIASACVFLGYQAWFGKPARDSE